MDLITVTRRGGAAYEVRLRGHTVVTDLSVAEGGQDQGFSPVELVAGALGACLAMMAQRYCDARGYEDGDVGASLTLELADDPMRVGAFTVDVELPRDFPEAERQRLGKAAVRFPVPATLRSEPGLDIEFT